MENGAKGVEEGGDGGWDGGVVEFVEGAGEFHVDVLVWREAGEGGGVGWGEGGGEGVFAEVVWLGVCVSWLVGWLRVEASGKWEVDWIGRDVM